MIKWNENVESFESDESFIDYMDNAHEQAGRCGQARYITIRISPVEARIMLARNHHKNTRRSPLSVRAYASDMANGRWGRCADPITIVDDSGAWAVASGKHRLEAIIESGSAYEFAVCFGLTWEEFAMSGDGAMPRTPAHRLKGLGFDCDPKDLAACRMYLLAPQDNDTKFSSGEIVELFKAGGDIVKEAKDMLGKCNPRLKQAAIIAAIARALPYVGRETMQRFCDIYTGKVGNADHEIMARRLSDYILNGLPHMGSSATRRQIYGAAQYCIEKFEKRSRGKKVISNKTTDLYPHSPESASTLLKKQLKG